MPGPVIIEPQNTGAAPLSYQLAPGQTLEVLAVAAEFDGTNAAGSFVPAVGFYAADGRRLARCPAPTTVAAGDSSEVSFFPFAPPASSSGGGSTTVGFESANGGSTSGLTVGSSATFSIGPHVYGETLLDYTTPANPVVLADGWYQMSIQFEADDPADDTHPMMIFASTGQTFEQPSFGAIQYTWATTFVSQGSIHDSVPVWTLNGNFLPMLAGYGWETVQLTNYGAYTIDCAVDAFTISYIAAPVTA